MKLTFESGLCVLAIAVLCMISTAAFADNYNYVLTTTNGSNGHANFTYGLPLLGIQIVGADGVPCCGADTNYAVTFTSASTISFDWTAHSFDSGGFYYDPFSIIVDGVKMVNVNGGTDASGSFSYDFVYGDTLAFDIYSVDGCCGAGTATISNYYGTPEPGSLFLMGSGLIGLVGAVRRKIRL